MSVIKVRVESVCELSHAVRGIRLAAVEPVGLPAFDAGAHVDVCVPDGRARSYSLTNALDGQAPRHYDIAVARGTQGGGVSQWLHDELECGDFLQVSAPRNHFRLDPGDGPALLVAGGIGITPLWAMAQSCERSGRRWHLVYAARSRAAAAFLPELERFPGNVTLHFDDECGGRPLDVSRLVQRHDVAGHVYCCGPDSLMQAVRERHAPLLGERLHFEWFKAPEAASDMASSSFEVVLSRSRQRLNVPAGCSLLDVLEQHGIVVPSVCREGVCGTCECTVLSGVVDHRDQILTEPERAAHTTMMACVSRAIGSELVLDL